MNKAKGQCEMPHCDTAPETICCRCFLPIHRNDPADYLGDRVAHRHSRCIELLKSEHAAVVERLEARVGELELANGEIGLLLARSWDEHDAALARITALEALVAGAYREGWSDRGGLRMESQSAAYQRRELAWESSIARASLADKDGDSKA